MPKSQIYIGIDPGFTGGIGIIENDKLIQVYDCPLTIINKGKTKIVNFKRVPETERRVDGKGIYEILKHYKNAKLVIEHSQAMPDQGEVSIAHYMEGYGRYLGVLDCLGINFVEVRSSVWKRKMNLSSDKWESIHLIQEKLEGVKEYVHLRKHDGRAEALLLAIYGRDYLKWA